MTQVSVRPSYENTNLLTRRLRMIFEMGSGGTWGTLCGSVMTICCNGIRRNDRPCMLLYKIRSSLVLFLNVCVPTMTTNVTAVWVLQFSKKKNDEKDTQPKWKA